jgi:hypothetical protein
LRFAKKLSLSVAAAVAGVLLVEGGLRLVLRVRGTPFDFREVASTLRSRRDAAGGFAPGIGTRKAVRGDGQPIGILHPFAASENEHDSGKVLEHFRSGVPPDELSLLIVGGSVAVIFADTQGPALEEALKKIPKLAGREIAVLDYAHPSHKQPQQLMRVAWLLTLGYRPDVVVDIDGFNETALATENGARGTNPLYPSFPSWGVLVSEYGAMDPRVLDLTLELWKIGKEARGLADFCLDWKLYHSCLWSRLALARLDGIQRERVRLQSEIDVASKRFAEGDAMRRQIGGPEYATDPDAVLRLAVRGWAEASRSLRALCESRGILYLHVLQPALGDRGSKPLSEKEKAIQPPSEWWMRGPELGYPMLREEGRALAKEGEAFVDASRAFESVEKPMYIDPCHLTVEGNRILEKAVEQALVERLGGK